ncbi:lipid-A-disaccharide synthase [Opitutia bacterium ISCC 51]|nr:lipid-A-disaccharide synthase [Opitutae bacterium ISCC 51]QXD27119.1 lipid-A-disaccharide synthase [Opitutae bacterium ISCC 52]
MSYVPVLPDELASPAQGTVDILVIAGEHSGDEHAAVVIHKLLQEQPDLKIAAVGGELMKDAGAQLLFDLTHLSVVGFFEVLKHYKYFKQLFGKVIDWVDQNRPRAVLFVDYPGFNLRLAKALFEKGIAAKAGGDTKLLYYIGPQIWAWKAKRRFEMDRLLDGLSVIFPFEVECYADTQLETTFVGHPFLQSKQDCDLVYNAEGNLLLLAGSRVSNVRRVLPVLLEAYERFLANYEGRDATLVYPSETILSEIEQVLESFPKAKERISLVRNEGRIEAGAVLTTSGTMSLRCGLAGIPGRIVHRIQGLSYVLGRMLVSIPYIGIANLLLEKPYYPEYIQGDAKPSVLAKEIDRCLTDQEVIQQTQDDCKELHQRLKQENDETPWNWLIRYL